MASFRARALDLQAAPQPAGFADVDPSGVHAANIEALFAAQVTAGCTEQPLQYCPSNPVTRAQMASFLKPARWTCKPPHSRPGSRMWIPPVCMPPTSRHCSQHK